MNNIIISIKNLYKIFGDNPKNMMQYLLEGISKQDLLDQHNHVLALNNINLDIKSKHIHVIMGLSGSGKSTLIRHINRLIEPTSGKLIVDGKNMLEMSDDELREFRRFKASMVFQKFALLPHRSVIKNVAYGLLIQGVNKVEAYERSQKWIDKVSLNGYENSYPYQLSGGMQQRVGLARAMATDAGILLMDEAFSSLDPLIRSSMQEILLELQKELNKTIIFITHDLNEALRIGDQISILRDGEIIQTGSPEDILLGPKDKYISNFIKDINRGRMLKVSSIMRKNTSIKAPKILDNISIEDAIPILASASEGLAAVVNKNGNIIGKVSLDSAISALSSKK
tara:strand:+ start:3224 stop:4243 length:1020 start_codon:yes stop_codon:yes gene_type:complete